MSNWSSTLAPEDARIWRITHRDNLKYIFAEGLVAPRFCKPHSGWISIGNSVIIDRRAQACVPGTVNTLSEFVPFYFTPFSPMLYNILTGKGNVQQRTRSEIVIFETSLHRIERAGLRYFFTSEHALSYSAKFFDDLTNIDKIDWRAIQKRDFSRDENDPSKMTRYQAEALVYRQCPISLLSCIHCFDEESRQRIVRDANSSAREISVPITVSPDWYFS